LANTRGVSASYETTLGALSVEVQASPDDGVVITRDVLAAVALPSEAELDQLVADVERRIRWTRTQAAPPFVGTPVLLMPRALRQLLRPVERALLASEQAGNWALAGAMDEQRFSPDVHISDAPLLPGRPGSRPIDDDGVIAHGHVLVEDGIVRRFLCDLATGARLQRPSTGSARRSVFGPSRPSFSNLVLQAGTRSLDELLQVLGDGLVIDDLTGGAGAVSSGGSFRFPVATGCRVSGGDVVGRVDGVAISGNAFEMLARVVEVGADSRWVGSALLPPLLVDGVEVGAR
jgi:PmbA protein